FVESTDFTDKHRLKEVIQKHYTALESSLNQNAMRYAINLSASGLDIPSKIANEWYGLEYYWKIKEIASDLTHYLGIVIDKMKELQTKLLGLENPHLVITCDAPMYDELRSHDFYNLAHLTTKPYTPWIGNYPLVKIEPQGRVIPTPI